LPVRHGAPSELAFQTQGDAPHDAGGQQRHGPEGGPPLLLATVCQRMSREDARYAVGFRDATNRQDYGLQDRYGATPSTAGADGADHRGRAQRRAADHQEAA
jgi:hypothetical protein